MGRGLVAAVAASLLMSVMADCSKSSKVVRSSNAWATGYDEWCGHGDPCACERGRMKKKSGTSTMYEGRSWDEYYCCTAECDDSKCTSPDGKGGTDCDVAATVGERFTCAAGWTPQRLNFKPAYDILGLPLYKYSCCRWPDGKEPELPNEAAIGAIIAGVVGGLVGVGICVGIGVALCCCRRQAPKPGAPMQAVVSQAAPASTNTDVASAPTVTPDGQAAQNRFCQQCGAPQPAGKFCDQCGAPLGPGSV